MFTIDDIIEAIRNAMDRHAPCDNDSDYLCAFCGKRHNHLWDRENHKPDCDGWRSIDALEKKKMNGEE